MAARDDIKATIKQRQDTEVRPKTIMTRQHRQEFWSDVAKNEEEAMRDRLRASELLGKSEADFVDIKLDIADGKKSIEECQQQIDDYHERLKESKNGN